MSCKFESLEGRRMMSATAAAELIDEMSTVGRADQPAPVMMAMRAGGDGEITRAAGTGVDVRKIVGKYKHGTSLFFSSVMHIKSVSADGKIVGKVNIPWLATCSIRGTIDKATGRFTIRFSETTESPQSRMNGNFKGKMHPSGKYLTGTFKYYYGTDAGGGVKPYTANYSRH